MLGCAYYCVKITLLRYLRPDFLHADFLQPSKSCFCVMKYIKPSSPTLGIPVPCRFYLGTSSILFVYANMLTRTCFRDAFVRFTFSLKCSNNSGCVYTQVWYTMIVRTYLRIFDLPYRQHQYSMLSLSYLKGATILYSIPYMD